LGVVLVAAGALNIWGGLRSKSGLPVRHLARWIGVPLWTGLTVVALWLCIPTTPTSPPEKPALYFPEVNGPPAAADPLPAVPVQSPPPTPAQVTSGSQADKSDSASGYPEAFNKMADRIRDSHPDFSWIVDHYDTAMDGGDRVMVLHLSALQSPQEYRRIGSSLYEKLIACRKPFFSGDEIKDCWVLVLDNQSNQVVRVDSSGAHLLSQ
jgi:hypothetical protein